MNIKKIISILCCLAGAIYSYYLGVEHFELINGLAENSWCNINSTFNCGIVNSSKYSEVFGISLGFWGLLYFAINGISIAIGGKVTALINLVGTASTIFLFILSSFFVGALCLQCIIIYALVLVPAFLNRPLLVAMPAVGDLLQWGAISLVGFFGIYQLNSNIVSKYGTDPLSQEELFARYKNSPIKPVEDHPWVPKKGPNTAVLKIDKWVDFHCPHCKEMTKILDQLSKVHPEDVQIRFRHFPLSGLCNKEIKQSGGPMDWVCNAALMSNCMNSQGKFWEFEDELFRNQEKLTSDTLKNYLPSSTDQEKLNQCMAAKGAEWESIGKDVEDSKLIPLQGTPTLLLNGHYMETPMNFARFKKLVAALKANP